MVLLNKTKNMKVVLLVTFIIMLLFESCKTQKAETNSETFIANGQMPNITRDTSGNIHIVYGNGDSLLYSFSSDAGKTFSISSLIAVLPHLAASHMRGPQIATTEN